MIHAICVPLAKKSFSRSSISRRVLVGASISTARSGAPRKKCRIRRVNAPSRALATKGMSGAQQFWSGGGAERPACSYTGWATLRIYDDLAPKFTERFECSSSRRGGRQVGPDFIPSVSSCEQTPISTRSYVADFRKGLPSAPSSSAVSPISDGFPDSHLTPS